MPLSVTEVSLTASYAEQFTILPGTVEVLLELPESQSDQTLGVFIKSIDGVDPGLSEGGVLDTGGAWTLKFSDKPCEQTIVVHAKASTTLSGILTVWTK